MADLSIRQLLSADTLAVRDVVCRCKCGYKSTEECTNFTHVVFPYRGVFMRHVGRDESVAEANQVLFFNQGESYRIGHPIGGGDSCLSIGIEQSVLHELVPKESKRHTAELGFRIQRSRIDPATQALMTRVRHSLSSQFPDRLEGEVLTLELVRHAVGARVLRTARSIAINCV